MCRTADTVYCVKDLSVFELVSIYKYSVEYLKVHFQYLAFKVNFYAAVKQVKL